MISIKKYLDSQHPGTAPQSEPDGKNILPVTVFAYRSALQEIGSCSLDACPALGEGLKKELANVGESLSRDLTNEKVASAEVSVREKIQDWGRRAAGHYEQKTNEVKEILLVLAHTAESVGARDQRCAQQITDVTTRLKTIANLEDLTQIRASIEKSASELKTSIDRMTEEGKAAIEQLRGEITSYQAKLEEAEKVALRDSLTGSFTRRCVENQILRRIESSAPFCLAILDIDGFKQVNDEYGHLIGDELLKQFATELQSRSRTTDLIGRWGGDEFIILLDCPLAKAKPQIERLHEWVCGNYTVNGNSGPVKLRVSASIGLAEHRPRETSKSLIDRADADMYKHKAASKATGKAAMR
jgi:diguanylate cyclase (GGDEF)-like protein